MSIFTHIIISVVFYFILLFLSTNILGFLVRGLFTNPELDKLQAEGHDYLQNEIKKSKRVDFWINIIALIIMIGFFYMLVHFWNVGVLLASIIMMGGRLPDLIWEIKHGKKLTYANTKLLERNALYFISAFLPWLALPVLFYSLYYLK